MLQQLLVASIVALAAGYSAWRLGGTAARLRLADALARRLPGAAGVAFARLAARQRALLQGGCAACGATTPRQRTVRK